MSNSNLSEIFVAAQGYHCKNGYDLSECDLFRHYEEQREQHWHHSLALAVDDLELTSFEKLNIFSDCIRNLGNELSRLAPRDIQTPF